MKALACFMKGFRTILAAGSFVIVGLLGVLGTLDLSPLVQLFVKDPEMLPLAMLGVGALFGYLRYVTSTPLFSKLPSDPDEIMASLKRDIDAGV